jgi:hypothetical protein
MKQADRWPDDLLEGLLPGGGGCCSLLAVTAICGQAWQQSLVMRAIERPLSKNMSFATSTHRRHLLPGSPRARVEPEDRHRLRVPGVGKVAPGLLFGFSSHDTLERLMVGLADLQHHLSFTHALPNETALCGVCGERGHAGQCEQENGPSLSWDHLQLLTDPRWRICVIVAIRGCPPC